MNKKDLKSENFLKLWSQIDNAESEDDIDAIDDIAEAYLMGKLITKKHYDFLCEEMDGRISQLVELGKI